MVVVDDELIGRGAPATGLRRDVRRRREAASAATDATDATASRAWSLPDGLRFSDKGASTRRRFPIAAYVGMNGSGKSLAMIHDTIPSLLEGRRVLSTVRLVDPATGEDHPLYERLTSWGQLLEAEHCDVLMDEVQGIADSRASTGMPVQVRNFIGQLRRNDVSLRWTTPSWNWTDVRIRDVTRAVTVCRGYLPRLEEGIDSVWPSNRLFRWTTYDASEFTRWTDGTEEKIKGRHNTWYWRPRWAAQRVYDTLDSVDRIGEVLDSGRCAYCGGTRRAPECDCNDYLEEKDRRKAKTSCRH